MRMTEDVNRSRATFLVTKNDDNGHGSSISFNFTTSGAFDHFILSHVVPRPTARSSPILLRIQPSAIERTLTTEGR